VQSLKCVVGELVAAVSQRVDSDSIRDLGVRPKVPDLFVMKWHSAPVAAKNSICWLKPTSEQACVFEEGCL
jgi:hypothetical protein